jgi:hypothetical protein
MMRSYSLEDLVARSKVGEVTKSELAEVVRSLREGAGEQTYKLLYVLARAGSREHEELVARYLDYEEDPQVVALALSALCVQWQMASRYRDYIRKYLRGVDWDVLDEARISAISASGEYLRSARDCSLLHDLLYVAEAGGPMLARFSVEAVARALGEPHSRSVPPSEDESREWAAAILARGSERYLTECDNDGGRR